MALLPFCWACNCATAAFNSWISWAIAKRLIDCPEFLPNLKETPALNIFSPPPSDVPTLTITSSFGRKKAPKATALVLLPLAVSLIVWLWAVMP